MKIVNFEKSIEKNELATFDIYFDTWQMTFHRWKVKVGKKGPYLTGPKYMKEKDGVKTFYPYISFSREKWDDFEKSVWQMIREFMPIEK